MSERQAAAPASPDLVRRVVLEAAERAGLDGWRAASDDDMVGMEPPGRERFTHYGHVRRDSLANLLSDARTLAEQASTAWCKEQAQRPISSEQASAGCQESDDAPQQAKDRSVDRQATERMGQSPESTHVAQLGSAGPTAVAVDALTASSPVESKEWNAESVVRRVLGRGPSALVEALDGVLGGSSTSESPVARVATTIAALGQGPGATLALVEACYEALSVVEQEQAEDFERALETVRALLCEWLPKRLPDGTQVTLRHRVGARLADACPDMTATTHNAILVDAYVGHADDMPLSVASQVQKDDHGRDVHTMAGTRRYPVPSALGAEMSTVERASDEMADAIASQFPGQYEDSRDGRRRFARQRLALLRRPGFRRAPRYMALKVGAIPEDVLAALKEIYPALRFVLLSGAHGDVEEEIVHYLLMIFTASGEGPDEA